MAYIGLGYTDFRTQPKLSVCLNKSDCEIVLKALGPLIGRQLKTYEYYKDIHDSGYASEKQDDKYVQAEEDYHNIIDLRNTIFEYLKKFDK